MVPAQMLHGQLLHGQMLHEQWLHGQMLLGYLLTVKDGSTNLKWPLRYFPWGDGGMGGEMSKLMLTQCLVRQTQNLFTSIHLKYDQVLNINIVYC